ncbi:MAG: ANTAR domain-containing protein [Patescibacteria group bacterium]
MLKRQLALLERIMDTISYKLDLDEVLKEVVELVSDTMKADSCLIYLVQDDHLILKASKIPHPKMINQVAMKFGEGITGWVAEHRQLVALTEQSYADKRFKVVPYLDEDRWEAFVSVPIIYQDEIVGVINVQHRRKKQHPETELRLLRLIATQVGGAIYNAKLISETQTLKAALETRKVVEKAKGILMKKQQLTEEQAYGLIQKKSMDTKKTMKEIAEAIIIALSL